MRPLRPSLDDDGISICISKDEMDSSISETSNDAECVAKRETKAIFWLKLIFVLVLCITCSIMATFTYLTWSKTETRYFERAFEEEARRLIDAFYLGQGSKVWAASALSTSILLFASQNNLDFPNVTVPGFDLFAFSIMLLGQASSISFSPLIKDELTRETWEAYVIEAKSSLALPELTYSATNAEWKGEEVEDGIFHLSRGNQDGEIHPVKAQGLGPFFPQWQVAPLSSKRRQVMFDQANSTARIQALENLLEYNLPLFSDILDDPVENRICATCNETNPTTVFFYPISQPGESGGRTTVGTIGMEFEWKTQFQQVLHENYPVRLILENACGSVYTFHVTSKEVEIVGPYDDHDLNFDSMKKTSSRSEQTQYWTPRFQGREIPRDLRDFIIRSQIAAAGDGAVGQECKYTVHVYPTEEFKAYYVTSSPIFYTVGVIAIFLFTGLVFFAYDHLVERRQAMVMDTAVRSSAIVRSLFPAKFRDRLFKNKERKNALARELHSDETGFFKVTPLIRLTNFLQNSPHTALVNKNDEPMAEMFTHTTVMFGDIAGFTAWSSEREPSQVFKLLETLYAAFDTVAKRLNVFKVETIGDCYVAVTGLPEPNRDHAITMARFAYECVQQMSELTKELETLLGPGTSDLVLRIGLHSGPVTAGVLRGEKSRFQLFGDTMNTASRMESTGSPGKIHVSKGTCDLICAAGKQHWLTPRPDMVTAKGKGAMQTYWLEPTRRRKLEMTTNDHETRQLYAPLNHAGNLKVKDEWGSLSIAPNIHDEEFNRNQIRDHDLKIGRLVDWNAEILLSLLSKITMARSKSRGRLKGLQRLSAQKAPSNRSLDCEKSRQDSSAISVGSGESVLDCVTEVISLPKFDPKRAKKRFELSTPDDLDEEVRSQLKMYVAEIASIYHDVPFHNFEHASHVALSANKLIKRIISPDDVNYKMDDRGENGDTIASDLHYSTFGISSDPLTQFAVVFAALVHDVDHTGLPNSQLVKEEAEVAIKYSNKSVAEQHSVNLALQMLNDPKYRDLYRCICPDNTEALRFRQLFINAVMATDIVDSELKQLRQNRWNKAFHEPIMQPGEEDVNRKATIVIEHIIQASDVAHTMQHWHIFRKWNARLYNEMYDAYLAGRADKDPGLNWYESELGFFDFYIIPLAKKLEECGVFGVSSDEYLTYALENRREWEMKGKQVTKEMIEARQRDGIYRRPAIQRIINRRNSAGA